MVWTRVERSRGGGVKGVVRVKGCEGQRVVRVKGCGWWESRGGVMGGGMVNGVGWWSREWWWLRGGGGQGVWSGASKG